MTSEEMDIIFENHPGPWKQEAVDGLQSIYDAQGDMVCRGLYSDVAAVVVHAANAEWEKRQPKPRYIVKPPGIHGEARVIDTTETAGFQVVGIYAGDNEAQRMERAQRDCDYLNEQHRKGEL